MLGDLDGANPVFCDEVEGGVGVVCVDFVGCVATYEVQNRERTAWMGVEPRLRDSYKLVAVDHERVAGEDPVRDLLPRPDRVRRGSTHLDGAVPRLRLLNHDLDVPLLNIASDDDELDRSTSNQHSVPPSPILDV